MSVYVSLVYLMEPRGMCPTRPIQASWSEKSRRYVTINVANVPCRFQLVPSLYL
jgi:hypothetical protein